MKNKLKKILKIFINDSFISKYRYVWGKYSKEKKTHGVNDKIKCVLFEMNKYHFIYNNDISSVLESSKQNIIYSNYFSYFIDFKYLSIDFEKFNHNMTPDYSVILKYGLDDFKKMFKSNEEITKFLYELESYLDKYILCVEASDFKNKENVIRYLKSIKNNSCQSLEESLQRILFYNQIFWQLGYNLCGLGRLDYILIDYLKDDENVEDLILDFLKILNSYYNEKSGCLSGDTGQIIIIGGTDNKGHIVWNKLTESFILALEKHNRPDPKLLLRVNKDFSKDKLKNAIKLMLTGIGSPLISNDDVVIPKMIKYGYDKKDAWNYVTAACWEPSPCGNSIDLNSIITLNFLKPFNEIFMDNEYRKMNSDNILEIYFDKLSDYIHREIETVNSLRFQNQPYLSLFIENCRKYGTTINGCDVKYKNLGITTLGIANVVNSILNINKFVFDKKIISLDDLNNARKSNFEDEKILKMLKQNNKHGYCSKNNEAILLTNKITDFISNEFEKYKNYYGGKFKFGLSAPSYVEHGKGIEASFDGRKDNEPLNVHISSNYTPYLEIIDFASEIEYPKNAINGNVVDFILSPNYITNNSEKFIDYIMSYIKKGFYQLQINVIDSKTLIAAKENPELYNNLIVRVWGFSAYFNDLPEEYKELLIERARQSEGIQNYE